MPPAFRSLLLRTAVAYLPLLTGCQYLWAPFLGDNPVCVNDPSRCQLGDGGALDGPTMPPSCSPDGWCVDSSLSPSSTAAFYGVWGADVDLWVVGSGGTIWKREGSVWSQPDSRTPNQLNAVWGIDANNVWSVGAMETMVSWVGGSQNSQSGNNLNLYAVWGLTADSIFAVGDGGTILKKTGSSWLSQITSPTTNLRGVWGADTSHIWAVGEMGLILRFDGTNWGSEASHTTGTLRGVWGSSVSDAWAVGDGGTIVKWSGTAMTWSVEPSSTTSSLAAVAGVDSQQVWAVGAAGTILKRETSVWTAQHSGTTSDLFAVWASAHDVWAVGAGGTLLHKTQ